MKTKIFTLLHYLNTSFFLYKEKSKMGINIIKTASFISAKVLTSATVSLKAISS